MSRMPTTENDPLIYRPTSPLSDAPPVVVQAAESPTSMPVTSRLAKSEEKKLTQQILMYLGLAIGLGLLFIFLVVPGLIRLMNLILGDTSSGLEVSDTIPPQVPSLSAPVTATNSGMLTLQGVGEKTSQVILVHNGERGAEATIGDDGKFSLNVELHAGENALSLVAKDKAGNESAASRTYNTMLDKEVPTLDVIEPQEGQTFETRRAQVITIKGTTEAGAKVFVNGRMTQAGSDGAFSTTYQLQDGTNTLNFEAKDAAGNAIMLVRMVNFKP
jgi:hypothetical protein